jgi:hypothetical protein
MQKSFSFFFQLYHIQNVSTMWYNICNKQKNTKQTPAFAPQPTYTHPMLLLNPPPWKVIFHAIYPELCRFAGGTYCSIDAEKISILYLYLSKDIMKPYLVEMILGLFPIKNSCLLLFYYQSEWPINLNWRCMILSSLLYIPSFSVQILSQLIYSDCPN